MKARSALGLLIVASFLALWIPRASAQDLVASWVFVRDDAGDIWLVVNGTRIGIPILPATNDEIVAMPFAGQWIGPADTSGQPTLLNSKPEWAQAGTVFPPQPQSQSQPRATATTPREPERPIKLTGSSSGQSQVFQARGGPYRITWTGRGDQYGCFLTGTIMAAEGRSVQSFGNPNDDAAKRAGETHVSLNSGSYYIRVASDCTWTISVTPE